MTISSEPSAEYGKRGPILVYRLSIVGRNAKVVGTTELDNRNNPGGQSWIQGKLSSALISIEHGAASLLAVSERRQTMTYH